MLLLTTNFIGGEIMKRICKVCGYIDITTIEKCPVCQANQWEDYEINQIKEISSDKDFIQAMMNLKEKDPIEYQLKLNQFKIQQEQAEKIKEQQRENSKLQCPHCPHCHSTNIKSISGLNRGASIAMWGIFSKKINKSFECKNCGYTW